MKARPRPGDLVTHRLSPELVMIVVQTDNGGVSGAEDRAQCRYPAMQVLFSDRPVSRFVVEWFALVELEPYPPPVLP